MIPNWKWRRSRPNECGRSVDQAAGTLFLRGLNKIYTARREAPTLRGVDGVDGLDGVSKFPSIYFIFSQYIGKVYTYL